MAITLVRAAMAAITLTCAFASGAENIPSKTWMNANALEAASARTMEKSDLKWYDAAHLTIEGKGFVDSVTSYSRLAPRHKAGVTTGVWSNGQSAAGVTIRFVTDAPLISAAWSTVKDPMPHMAWSGSGGVDLYALEGGQWKFRGAGNPTTTASVAVVQKSTGHGKTLTEYMMFLPLYSTISKVEIGIPADATISAAPKRYDGKLPIVFYGTSITQGGCASRAGMNHVGILRRQLDYPVVNLGFSGSGKCELGVAQVMAEVPAALYVIETVQNMTVEQVQERLVPFVRDLRKRQPKTPILLVESPNMWSQGEKHVAWKQGYEQLIAEGLADLHYLPGNEMYSSLEDGTVDRTHPTDLGFYTMAVAYEPVLRELLKLDDSPKKAFGN